MGMGDNIKQLRLEKGWTQEELGKLVGVQKSAIAKYENGRVSNMRRPMIQKMAEIFGVDPSFLMGFEDDRETDELLSRLLSAGGKLPKENLEAFVQAMEMAANACEHFKGGQK